MPKLSIITINLNNKEGLEKTIASVVNQTYQDFEYLIIDGGSTDGSVDVIKKYENHIHDWVSEKDTGIYNAMNKGIRKAKGEYLLFLNSGDYLYEKEVLQKFFSENPQEDIVYGDIVLEFSELNSHKTIKLKEKSIKKTLFWSKSLPHPCSFIKKELFLKIGLYNESFKIVSDCEFFVKAIFKKKASYKRIPLKISVFNNQGISSNPKLLKQKQQEINLVMKQYLNKFEYFLYLIVARMKKLLFIMVIRKFLRKILIQTGILKIIHNKKIIFRFIQNKKLF